MEKVKENTYYCSEHRHTQLPVVDMGNGQVFYIVPCARCLEASFNNGIIYAIKRVKGD